MSSFCFNFSQKILKLISLILFFIGILIISFIFWLRSDESFELKLRQILFSDPSMGPPELIDTKIIFRQTFACCGDDDNTATYNYRCIEFGQPTCQQLLLKYFNLIFISIGIFLTILIFIELLAIIICIILLCNNKREGQQ
uniref:Tetraspanin n=1 Tax=Meloidogyne hapla TaxID=6305 RepID=A0A1I8B0B7_MELHA